MVIQASSNEEHAVEDDRVLLRLHAGGMLTEIDPTLIQVIRAQGEAGSVVKLSDGSIIFADQSAEELRSLLVDVLTNAPSVGNA